MKPIVKWAGGKIQVLSVLERFVPEKFGRYFEPFVGGGALFLHLQLEKAVLNDMNPQLINMYRWVADDPEVVMGLLDEYGKKHLADAEFYYEARERFNQGIQDGECSAEMAALFVYLNKTGFNGLYRLNGKGLFNVSKGKQRRLYLYTRENLLSASTALKEADLRCGDFEEACRDAKEGDFVFFDSPYYATYDSYQAGGLSEEDHIRLAKLFRELSERGVYCLLTNSDTEFIWDLYEGFTVIEVPVMRNINRDAKGRTGREILVKSGEPRDRQAGRGKEDVSVKRPKHRQEKRPALPVVPQGVWTKGRACLVRMHRPVKGRTPPKAGRVERSAAKRRVEPQPRRSEAQSQT